MELANVIMQVIQEAGIEEKYDRACEKENDLEKHLVKVWEHYWKNKTCYSQKCEATAKQLLMTILTEDKLKGIHSARYRTKTIDSLIIKYVKKKALLPDMPGTEYSIEKYRPMNKDNYYKIITDLIGIRILIRYQKQWEVVHEWIWETFHKTDKSYIKNWLEEYPAGETDDFLVEKPKLYLRDQKDLSIYKKFGEDIFEDHVSNEGYSSIHYLLWYDGKYVEIQVRTIYDEAWGECTHDLVYKCKDQARRVDLERLSQCLATQTQAAGMVADMMFEKSQAALKKEEEQTENLKNDESIQTARYEKLQKHLRSMNKSKEKKQEFDGAIDGLI